MNKKNKLVVLLLLAVQTVVFSQTKLDTAATIKTFNKVMAFTAQKFVHYTTVTRLTANPVMQSRDTATIYGEFFKNNTEIYSNNGVEEMYLQDSLMVQVNHDRKTIWLSKVDVASKDKMDKVNLFAAGSKDLLRMTARDFVVSQLALENNEAQLSFESRKPQDGARSSIIMTYNTHTGLPKTIVTTVLLQQPVNEEMLAYLKEQQVDEAKLLQEINGVKYWVSQQQITVSYTDIDNDKEKLAQMPIYSNCIAYDGTTHEFKAFGKYKDYEITQLF